MNSLKNWVAPIVAYLVSEAARYAGIGNNTRNSLIQTTYNVIYGPIGDIITIACAPIAWIYIQLDNINVSIPNWITDTVNFIIGTVRPVWNWVVNSIDSLVRSMNAVTGTIYNIAVQVVSVAFNSWRDVLDFANWLRVNFTTLLSQFLNDPYGFIQNKVIPILHANFPALFEIIDFWYAALRAGRSFISQFLADPVGWVTHIALNVLLAAIPGLSVLLSLIAWWRDVGGPFLVALVNNPAGVILDMIAERFVDWAMGVIARKW